MAQLAQLAMPDLLVPEDLVVQVDQLEQQESLVRLDLLAHQVQQDHEGQEEKQENKGRPESLAPLDLLVEQVGKDLNDLNQNLIYLPYCGELVCLQDGTFLKRVPFKYPYEHKKIIEVLEMVPLFYIFIRGCNILPMNTE